MKRTARWYRREFILLMVIAVGLGLYAGGFAEAAAEGRAVIRGSVSLPQGSVLLSLWAAATSSDGSHVYPATVTDGGWRIEVPPGTYFVEMRCTYRSASATSSGAAMEDSEKVGPISLPAGTTVVFSRTVKTAAPGHLSIEAPSTVAAGDSFTITVKTKETGQPVPDAEVYAVSRKIPVSEIVDPDSKGPVPPQGNLLGKTDAKGQLVAVVHRPGDYILYATREGYIPGTRNLTVQQARGLRLFTDKSVYATGETVLIVLYNGTSSTITIPSSAPWQISRLDGTVVYSPVALEVVRNLEPGQVLTWEWPQKDNQGRQVQPGTYLVKARTSLGDSEARFTVSGLRRGDSGPLPLPPLPQRSPFQDVTGQVPWSDPYILALYARGLVKGKTAGKFAPDDTISRAEFVALLLKAAGLDDVPGKIKKAEQEPDMFADVRWNHWAYSYIREALEMGLISKDEYLGGFGPDEPITRLEMAIMTVRAMGLEDEARSRAGDELPFTDAHRVEWRYRGYLAVAVEAGLLNGTDDGRIDPDGKVTRRQAAVVVWNALSGQD